VKEYKERPKKVKAFQLPFDITKAWVENNAPEWFTDYSRYWFFDDWETLNIKSHITGLNVTCSPYDFIVLQNGGILPYTESMFFAHFEELKSE